MIGRIAASLPGLALIGAAFLSLWLSVPPTSGECRNVPGSAAILFTALFGMGFIWAAACLVPSGEILTRALAGLASYSLVSVGFFLAIVAFRVHEEGADELLDDPSWAIDAFLSSTWPFIMVLIARLFGVTFGCD
jgi:hypothetical protein